MFTYVLAASFLYVRPALDAGYFKQMRISVFFFFFYHILYARHFHMCYQFQDESSLQSLRYNFMAGGKLGLFFPHHFFLIMENLKHLKIR